jgi:hypothetical protein
MLAMLSRGPLDTKALQSVIYVRSNYKCLLPDLRAMRTDQDPNDLSDSAPLENS